MTAAPAIENIVMRPGEVSLTDWRAIYRGASATLHPDAAEPIRASAAAVERILARGEPVGTLLASETPPLTARKQWLADHLQLNGKLVLDTGAISALAEGKSLLPIGVVEVLGDFERGSAVACVSCEGREIARGLTNYGSGEARRIARHTSNEIEEILGYIDEAEIIHRDNLILN